MELWASGFNAWNQLQFDGEPVAEPRDLQKFKRLLENERIEVLRTSLSATLGKSPTLIYSYSCSLPLDSGCAPPLSKLRAMGHFHVRYLSIPSRDTLVL